MNPFFGMAYTTYGQIGNGLWLFYQHYSCADQAVSGSTCSRMFQGRHSGEIEFIDLHRDPYTNKCKVRFINNICSEQMLQFFLKSIHQSRL